MTKLSAIGLLLFFCISCTGPAKHIPLTGKAKKDTSYTAERHEDSMIAAEQNKLFRQKLVDTSEQCFYIRDNDDLTYVLDTLGLKVSYEDALWRLYCLRCDKIVPLPKEFSSMRTPQMCLSDSLTYGELHLELKNVAKKYLQPLQSRDLPDGTNPVFKLSFSFGFRNQSCPFVFAHEACCDHSDYILELYYSAKYPTMPLYGTTGSVFVEEFSRNWFNPEAKSFISKVRIYNPMQPEVIAYIRGNSSKIDKWFLHKAEQEGVFDTLKYPQATIQQLVRQNKKNKQKTFFFE